MKVFCTSLFVFIAAILFAQKNGYNTLYLKNGSIIKGTIISGPSDSTTVIVTRDGSKFVYSKNDVDREEVNINSTAAKHGRTNYFWVGANIEPQVQSIFKSKKQYQNYVAQYPGGNLYCQPNGGVQAGLKLSFIPPGVAGFETGLQYHYYQSTQTETEQNYNYYGAGSQETLKTNNKFHCLEIPIYTNLHTQGKRVRFYSADGLSVGLACAARHSETFSGNYSNDTSFSTHLDSTASFYCTVLVSAGLQISLTQNVAINVSTAFRISSSGVLGATNPFYAPGPYPFVPYSIGLNIEVLFHAPGKNRSTSVDALPRPQKY